MKKTASRRARGPASPRLRMHFWATAALAAVGSLALVPGADARVNPLVIIQRQIHKANMLIVLDTSGSMTGVPGGTFYYKAEAGVDCDNGYNCRQAGLMGNCVASGKSCYSDEDCRRGTCSADASQSCGSDIECMPSAKVCSVSKTACTTDADCPAVSGKCSYSGLSCTTEGGCAAIGRCMDGDTPCGSTSCTNFDDKCGTTGNCQEDPSKVCETDAVCPQKASGNCANGGTPPSGCSDHADCPTKQKCQGTDETCRTTVECPGTKKGRCSLNGNTCNSNNQCNPGETCIYWTNACVGPPNPCEKGFTPCELCPSNSTYCRQQTNTCQLVPNTCVPATPSTCIPPAVPSDICGPSTEKKALPGPIRMCRASLTVCASNKDCASGDSCGPATSRMVIAKRAINNVISSNYDVVNFGLMTYYQDGYFPYYEMTGGGTTGTVTEFESKDKLINAGCFETAWGASPNCVISGTPMTLRLMQNSRYTVRTGPDSYVDAEQNFCGEICEVKGVGTGEYQGSFYQYDGVVGGNATSMVVMPSYTGKNIVHDAKNFTYYQALSNYYNGGLPPPFSFTDCETTGVCGAQCGGRAIAPYIDTAHDDNMSLAQSQVQTIGKRLEYASYGGLMAYWSTPTGCTLRNDSVSANPDNSVYHYMSALQTGDAARGIPVDPVACRSNYVLLITDGAANGPGDIDASGLSLCDKAECAAPDPEAAGCLCRSVLAAYRLWKDLGVRTYVIGFSGDVAAGPPLVINDNIARAGRTDADGDGVAPFALLAQREDELNDAIELAVLDAVRGSYSTAPTSSSAGTQQATTVAEGRYALDSRMDFPEWKGHLLSYDLMSLNTPCVNDENMMCPDIVWDAYTKLEAMDWRARRIYTWDGTDMVKFQIAADGSITNKAALAALGLGASPEEAERVARWAIGDPTFGNRARLGAIVNSTPLDIASPGDIPLPGGHAFFQRYMNRPHLVYVGSSDAMLHAFFLEDTTIGTTTYSAGTEAFAFAPPEMLPVIRRQYTQGGQRPSPYDHIFGLADSPKAKSLCIANCADAETAVWKTLLLMPEGYGGSEIFMLDVTDPFGSNGLAEPPFRVQWHSGYGAQKTAYDDALGNTISLPAFLMNKTSSLDDYRIIMTSGYPVTTGSTTQGRALLTSAARDGTIVTNKSLAPAASCAQEYTNLTDVATARDFAKNQDSKIIAAYFGDTAGRMWRYLLGGNPVAALDFGCDHPLHFCPTVAQIDRDSLVTNHAHEIYPVQVTNSNLDFDTTDLPPSKLIFWKEKAETDVNGNITAVVRDTEWGNGGKIELTVGNDAEICGVTAMDANGVITCSQSMPLNARPTATPLGVLKRDASGFQVYTMWYAPAPDGCTKGETFFTVHEMSSGDVEQRVGAMVASEPVTSPVVMRGQIMIFGAGGPYNVTGVSPDGVVAGLALPPATGTGQYNRLNWTELLE
ncbi:MAG: hypothetical protein JXP73_09285 [Deltaproteobacteria bacterium]|nr:hypothetical protein [Deltaproteobacteria bacterium]